MTVILLLTEKGHFPQGGGYSYAGGVGTKATNFASHAEEQITTASGWASHSERYNTIADGTSSHVQGK